jgi:WD40 repeat protein
MSQFCPNCSQDNPSRSEFCAFCHAILPGLLGNDTLLYGQYQITGLLGCGGMRAIYLAHTADRTVVIKENFDLNPNTNERFRREAAPLTQITHPNLPAVSDYFETDGRQYLVMEYIAGKNLLELLDERGGHLAEAEVTTWATTLLDALDYLHTRPQPIIHRDIKPANIKLTPTGQIKLVDFGLAKTYQPGRGRLSNYAPLEQYGAGRADPRSDIYALGATLYHLLAGKAPPEAIFLAAGQRLTSPRFLRPDLSPRVETVILRAISIDVAERFQSAAEMCWALRPLFSELSNYGVLYRLVGHTDWVRSVAFSPNGKTLASAGVDKTVRLWHTHDGRLLNILAGHPYTVMDVAFAPKPPPEIAPTGETLLAAALADEAVWLWRTDGVLLRVLKEHTGYVSGVAFSPDGALLASGAEDGVLRLWRVADGTLVNRLGGQKEAGGAISCVAFSPNSALLAAGRTDHTIHLWRVTPDGAVTSLAPMAGHLRTVSSVAFSPDGTALASGSSDNTIRLWQAAGDTPGLLLDILVGHTGSIRAVAFSPDGTILASASDDHTIRLWHLADGSLLNTLSKHTGPVWQVAFSPDGSRLASAGKDGALYLWEGMQE